MPNPQAQAPNFFSVVNEMAARFVELMKSDYKMPRRVNGKTRNRYASGTLYNSLAYRLQIKGKNIGVSVFAKGKASKYFLFAENGVNGTSKNVGSSFSFKRGSGSKPAKGKMSPMHQAIYDWMGIKPIRLRNTKGSFVKSSEALKKQVAYLIMRKIRRDGIAPWNAFEYAMENIWDEYEDKLFDAYSKDLNATIENNFE